MSSSILQVYMTVWLLSILEGGELWVLMATLTFPELGGFRGMASKNKS
jgi:hypothetical protein